MNTVTTTKPEVGRGRRPLTAAEVRAVTKECPVCGSRLIRRELPSRRGGALLQAACSVCGSTGQVRLSGED